MTEKKEQGTIVIEESNSINRVGKKSRLDSLPIKGDIQYIMGQKDQVFKMIRDPDMVRAVIKDDVNEPHIYLIIVLGLILLLSIFVTLISG